MKVLLINVLYKYGSTGRLCESIIKILDKNNIDNRIACRYFHNPPKNVYEISNWLDCHIHNRFVKYTGLQGYFSRLRTKKFLHYIKKENFDIVHLHNIFGSFLNIKLLVKFLIRNNIKVVYTLHDCQAFTGGCPYYSFIKCNKWEQECHNCPFRKEKLDFTNKVFRDKKRLLTSFKNNNFKITTVSNWLKSECEKSFLKKYEITTIYNGIDTKTFYKENRINNDVYAGKFVILGVANVWDERKGFDKFINLSTKLNEDEIIILIGLSKTQKDKLPDNVIGITRTNSLDELRMYYNIADVFINLSLEETFGLVVGEALACGTPSIVCNSTACPELVNEKCGIILETYDINSIYKAISIIKKNGKDYYSKYAIKHIKDNFSIEKMQEEYLKLYMHFNKE